VPGKKRSISVAPRVHIRYEDARDNARELPLVVGVLGSFSGAADPPLPRLRDRAFVDVNRESFDAVLQRVGPRLALRVDNKLSDDRTSLAVQLRFRSMRDFDAESIAQQVEPLRRLLGARQALRALLEKISRDREVATALATAVARARDGAAGVAAAVAETASAAE